MTEAAAQPSSRHSAGGLRLRWITVWSRAVVVPAWRRAVATWVGCAIVAAVLFGPTAMHPSDLTGLALHNPGAGAVLGVTWLLVFVPTARMIMQPAAGYLYSLPGNPRAARLIGGVALIVLQLPWLVLWIIGEDLLGVAVVLATTGVAAGLASWRPPRRRPTFPAWRRPGAALRAIHLRALRRRAGDALMRGAGIAVLAGIAAGLLVRNNHLDGAPAGVLGASLIAVVLVPAQVGAALVALTTHREAAWLAASSGISRATQIAALVHVIALVHLTAAAIAVVVAMVVAGGNPWLAVLALATALGTALLEVRAMLIHEASPTVAARVVIGAIGAAATAIVCLAILGASGAVATVAAGTSALLMVKP